jgi:hypothetical protein
MEVGDEGRWLDLTMFVSTDHDHMTSRHVSAHDPTRVVDSPQLATPSANASRICPSPLQRDVGGS